MNEETHTMDTADKPRFSRSLGLRMTSHTLYALNVAGFFLMGLLGWLLVPTLRDKFTAFIEESGAQVEFPYLGQLVMSTPPVTYLIVCLFVAVLLTIKEFTIQNRVITVLVEIFAAAVSSLVLGGFVIGVFQIILKLNEVVGV